MKRIGIYSGTFNPVHAGHISFALQAATAAKLDTVYLMPERYRAQKVDVAHFGHRVAMIRQAIKPYPRLGLIESSDVSFSVERTLPKLEAQFSGAQLVFLMGSDSLKGLSSWPLVEKLLKSSELAVGIREGDEQLASAWVKKLPIRPKELFLIDSYAPSVSSTKIRDALRRSQKAEGILPSVRRYSESNWLYISLA
jgi:nicotinate-nucleotide adenylyltransferase